MAGMTIIDTHTHLYLNEFAPDNEDVVCRAIGSGVDKLIFPNVDLSTIEPMKKLQSLFPTNIRMAMGLHPTEVNGSWREALATVKDEFFNALPSYVAVGEIGIDLYWDKSFRNEQLEVFAEQVEWALSCDLPIIIHCREGLQEVLSVLRHASAIPKGVFHSFGGSTEDVNKIRGVGDFYFGINGIVTFKNSNLKSVLPAIGLDRILLETDSPYLAPVPYRGKRNESAYIINIAIAIADILGVSVEKVAEQTTYNAEKLFKL